MGTVKTVGKSGQLSLGKQFAGRQVCVEETEPGVWTIRLGRFVPESELWLHEPGVSASIDRGIEWARQTPPAPTDLSALQTHRSRLRG